MTKDQEPMQDPDTQTPAESVEAKPKRTRRPRVAAADVVVGDAASAPQEEATAATAVAADAAPARKTARRRKADAVVEGADAGEAPVADAAVAQVMQVTPVVSEGAPPAVAAPADAADLAEPAPAPRRTRRKPASDAAAQGADASGDAPMAPAAIPAQPVEAAAPRRPAAEVGGRRTARGDADGREAQANANGSDGADGADFADGANGAEGAEGAEGEDAGLGPRRAALAAQQTQEVFDVLVSGDFDRDVEAPEAAAEAEVYKRVLRPEPDAPKLQKVLAQSGVGSRRDIEKMIEDGRIEVNDQVAHIGQRVSFGDRLKLDGKPIRARITPPPARILAYHKPVGEVVTHDDPEGRPTVFRALPRLQHGKWMSVGRLDLNTEGLLLFTTSGELANQLMHPRFGVEREYAVRVLGTLDDASRQRLLDGVDIEGQRASFISISKGQGEGVNHWYRVVIAEGRNREVRKLFDAVGLTVSRLMRVRYGAVVLPRGLKRGVWVELGESDVRAIKGLVGLDRQDQGQGQGQGGRPGKGGRNQPQQGKGGKPGRGNPPARGPHGQGQPHGQSQGPAQGPAQGQGGQARGPRPQQDRERVHTPRDDDDFDHIGPIPNPLEQTFDRRFVKSGTKRIVSGFGRPDQDHDRQAQGAKQKGPRQPDPMQTSVGYIGADAFFTGGGNRRGGGGGGGGGGGHSGGGHSGGGHGGGGGGGRRGGRR